ncbi:MAG TPA: F0F1 ATP synthase subunit gamma [Actinomycetes bacterium]|nr:F0F1 ATP synthase subunit gamma [Actinomycetes bacterium]
MAAQIRVLRRRIRSVQSTKKITRAMELIAASRIARAQARAAAAAPYAREITRVISAVASQGGSLTHPLVVDRPTPRSAAVIIVTSDRGLAGGYNSNILRATEDLNALLRVEGKEPRPYLVGRKGVAFHRFRQRRMWGEWTGFSEQPTYAAAKAVADAVIQAFIKGGEDPEGVDEVHIVYTQYISGLVQRPAARRLLPLVVEETTEPPPEGPLPLYDFEPDSEQVLDALLPRYTESRIFAALLEAAASESAARRRAMKAATDNAEEFIKALTREANAARQAAITQEISEIVGGADALVEAGS